MKDLGGDRIGRLLAVMVLQGLLALEDLDQPPDGIGWSEIEASRRYLNSRALRLKLPPSHPPGNPWRNLARDWITAHPSDWNALLKEHLEQEDQISHNPIEDLAAAA